MAKFEKILLEDDFALWRDKFNRTIDLVRLVEQYPDMTDKADYVLSNDGTQVKWISQEEILGNFGIKPGTGETTSFSDTVIIGNFAIILDANTGDITAKGDLNLDGNIHCKGSITADNGIYGDVTGNLKGNASTADKLKTARYIDGISFDGSKDIHHYGTCTTASATAAKVVTASGFKLYAGAKITVTFANTNTAALKNVTINVNKTGAKNFFIPGTSTQNTSYPDTLSGLFYTGLNAYDLVYNGTAYIVTNIYPRYHTPANANINLNACIYQGDYMFESSSTIANIPNGDNGWLRVMPQNPASMSVIKQVWYRYGTPGTNDFMTYVRTGTSSGSTWGKWSRYLCDNGDNVMNHSLTVNNAIYGKSNMTLDGTLTVNGASNFGGQSVFHSTITSDGNITSKGVITGTRVYNSVFNDYAEYFERGCDTQVGDIIALDANSDCERYVKATKQTANLIVGVHSDSYGHIVGGDCTNEEDNIINYIPVGLVGRVKVKVIGSVKKGDMITISDIPGIGIKAKKSDKKIGFAVESNKSPSIKYVRIKLELN